MIGQTADMVDGVQMSYDFSMELNEERVPLDSNLLIVSEPDLVIDKTVSVVC